MTSHVADFPVDLNALRSMLSGVMLADMDPVIRAEHALRISVAAVQVARSQGVIASEAADGLTDALAAMRLEQDAA